jgi:hypothetical protein
MFLNSLKKGLIILSLTLLPAGARAQETPVVKDLDGDHVADSAYIDRDRSVIVCRLSTQRFRKMESRPIEILNLESGIVATRNGFEFFNDWMRAGYKNQFRFDPKTGKMQLIGMSRYEFGNAANDGSGESSVNLLTGDYIGDWRYYDHGREVLVKIPTIKTKMPFSKVYLETFSEETYFGFSERCADLYHKAVKRMKRS